jgi:hypothetical protein
MWARKVTLMSDQQHPEERGTKIEVAEELVSRPLLRNEV